MQPQNTTNTKRHDNAHEQLPSYSSLQSSLRSSESKGKDMQREIETLKLLNSDLQQTIKERQQEIGNLISSKSALQQNLDSRQQEIGSLKFSKTALQKNLQVLKQENGNLKSSETDLQRHLDGLLDELDSQKLKAQTSFNVLLNESEQLKKDMKKLEALHIKSVNSVGTGLEPITDEKFIKRFRGLHDDVLIPISSLISYKSLLLTYDIMIGQRMVPETDSKV